MESALKSMEDVAGAEAAALVDWSPTSRAGYGRQSLVARHRLHETDAFDDASLEALIDDYPRDKLQIFTMGADPENRDEWEPVDTQGAGGRDILEATRVGKLWVKLMRLDLVCDKRRRLVERVYADIATEHPEFGALWVRPLMLISSPGAQVYYHCDPQNMMLWQLSGRKRIWVYPPKPPFLEAAMMEEIFAGDADEEIPYRLSFDESAEVFDLEPGDVLSWPLNAPHRVVNHDSVNVSLSVTVGTDEADRRSQLYQANLFLRRRLGMQPSAGETGIAPFCKRTGFRVARKLRLMPVIAQNREPYMARLRIDADAPHGVSEIPGGPVKTPF